MSRILHGRSSKAFNENHHGFNHQRRCGATAAFHRPTSRINLLFRIDYTHYLTDETSTYTSVFLPIQKYLVIQ